MQWFNNLSTRAKLFLGFGLMMALLATVIGTAYVSITTIQKSQEVLFKEDFTIALDLAELRAFLNRQRSSLLTMMLVGDAKTRSDLEEDIKTHAEEIDKILKELENPASQNTQLAAGLGDLKAKLDEYRVTRKKQIDLINAGQIDAAKQLSTGIQKTRFEAIRDLTRKLSDAAIAKANQAT